MRRESIPTTSALDVGDGVYECKPSSFPGGELNKARRRWANVKVHRDATMHIPNDGSTVTYLIRDGNLYRKGRISTDISAGDEFAAGDNIFIEALLWRTLRRFPQAPDADLVLSYGDVESPYSEDVHAPVFTFSSPREAVGDVGFPNPYLINEALDMKERSVTKGSFVKQVPWEDKKALAYWRGSLTGDGVIENASMVSRASRARLAKLASINSKDFDFAFTDVDLKDTWDDHVKSKMQRIFDSSPHSGFVSFYDVLPEYKYLLDVDGVSVAWRGLPLLASGSVVLLESGERGEFFFEDLKPFVHYVPVKKGLTDLMGILSYLRERDGRAQHIGMRGQQFAIANLSLPSLECYCLDALKFMSEVVTATPLHELQAQYHIDPVPEPNEHLQTKK